MAEIPFDGSIVTTTWTFTDGSRLSIESSDHGYVVSGVIQGETLRDSDGEDFFFPDSDSLLTWLERHGLIKVLTIRGAMEAKQ